MLTDREKILLFGSSVASASGPGNTPEDPILDIGDLSTLSAGDNVFLTDSAGRPLSDYAMIWLQIYGNDVATYLRLVREGEIVADTGPNYTVALLDEDGNTGSFTAGVWAINDGGGTAAANAAFMELHGFGLSMKTGMHNISNGPATARLMQITNGQHEYDGICDGLSIAFGAAPGAGKAKAWGKLKGRKNK